jgi:hypothetical protein
MVTETPLVLSTNSATSRGGFLPFRRPASALVSTSAYTELPGRLPVRIWRGASIGEPTPLALIRRVIQKSKQGAKASGHCTMKIRGRQPLRRHQKKCEHRAGWQSHKQKLKYKSARTAIRAD